MQPNNHGEEQHHSEINSTPRESRDERDRAKPTLRIQTPSNSEISRDEENSTPMSSRHNGGNTAGGTESQRLDTTFRWLSLPKFTALFGFSWVTKNSDMAHLKPIIRASVALWISLVLLVIPATENIMGTGSFLILVSGFLSPPIDPFMAVLERELAIMLLATTYFGYTSLAIFLADLARKNHDPSAQVEDIFSGQFIEVGPSIICGLFLFIGTAFLLYLRARTGPGPYIMAILLSCIVTDITLTTAPLYPYPAYSIGEGVLKPIAFHSACAIIVSATVFPETINARFIKRFNGVFSPLQKAMKQLPELLQKSPYLDGFDPNPFIEQITLSEVALGPLAAASRLLARDLSWGRFGPDDLTRLHEITRRLSVRANGLAFYFKIIDPVVGKQVGGFSVMNTPLATPVQSRTPATTHPTTPNPSLSDLRIQPSSSGTVSPKRRRPRHRVHSVSQNLYQHVLNFYHNHNHHSPRNHRHSHKPSSLFHEILNRSPEDAVGVFESTRYHNLESRLSHPREDEFIPRIMHDLADSTRDLGVICEESLEHIQQWIQRINENRFWKLYRRRRSMTWDEALVANETMRDKLQSVLDEFREKKRHKVLNMYRPHIDPDTLASDDPPPHKYLFQAYLYQYHFIFYTEHIIEILDEIIRLEKTRRRSKLWLPTLPITSIFTWQHWEPTDSSLEGNDDEDPETIQGIDPLTQEQLGRPGKRDPDALPPSNTFETIGSWFHRAGSGLGRGNAVFGIKAGIFSVVLSLPSFLENSAHFAYRHRSIWALIIGQLTLSRFRGDTTFGWVSRIIATFIGGLVGTVVWYISTGNGNGNPYGLAASCAVAFPIVLFIRTYYPSVPITLIIFSVTVSLVVGYSWQDATLPTLAEQGYGINVAWKRLLLVLIGVTTAFIFSFLPPSTTLRRNLRMTYAATAEQLGQAYCDVVSNASLREENMDNALVKDLVAIRMKLKRARGLMTNVPYEVSLRGKWPQQRYITVHEIQMELAYLLSHLRSVTQHLERTWSRAFLKRTRFLEPDFQGDILAVISMISTALRTGAPLPQVTPCPLLDRFVATLPGLNITRKDEEDFGLPRTITIETLEDEQYLFYSVGSALAWGILLRLDRLMVATKELVGEQYHIHGLPLYNMKSRLKKFR